MQSARIEQLEQRAAVRALAFAGAARRPPRAGGEITVESAAAPAERVTAVGISMFCSHLSE
ncbi:hypothetical protein AYM40_23330 [Paraburkholderia phytofirmans OLGA172]|uniref:Uncharacterized protein n=1 Tax=Paraburkholderia phytofirmans OLGA172 TaxID=1417228 RepID=A0A160FRC0_9BURK|nr:hypothetical protein AYM40_23330 [Paraburkholderia phytofirmans OLGA172]